MGIGMRGSSEGLNSLNMQRTFWLFESDTGKERPLTGFVHNWRQRRTRAPFDPYQRTPTTTHSTHMSSDYDYSDDEADYEYSDDDGDLMDTQEDGLSLCPWVIILYLLT